MKTVLLAGGLGTRLAEETDLKPKPMVQIGERPLLWHIMRHYAHHGHNEFVVALGYKGNVVKNYFLDYRLLQGSLTVDLGSGAVTPSAESAEDWRIHLVDTGAHTETGGRIKRCAPWLGREPFMLTYGDGVSDVDLGRLLAFHRSHGQLATLTGVRPPARFGSLEIEDTRITRFAEKPQAAGGRINGGFFVLEPGVLDYIDGDGTIFEREPLERLARDGQLMVYAHDGFWQPMDTLRDVRLLESLWASGKPPWKVWA